MRIHVRLFASFRERLPRETRGAMTVELPAGADLADLLDDLRIADPVKLITINGAPETHRDRILAEGDEVLVFPPVVGG
jgi:sulfur carrier protein ThiS